MIQPGRETNIPTASGSVAAGSFGSMSPVLQFNGFTLTMGMLLLAVFVLLAYQTFFVRKRR